MAAEALALAAAAWLLTYAVHSAVLLGGALAATRLLGRRERLAEVVWRVAMLGGLATATTQSLGLAPLGRRLILDVKMSAAATGGSARHTGTLLVRVDDWHAAIEHLIALAVLAYLVVAAIRLVALARARHRLHALLAPRTDAAPSVVEHARRLAGAIPLRITVSRDVATPMVVGTRELCLPARALSELSAEELDAVLAHEIAHLRRGDVVWLWVTALVERALFIQPLNLVAAARLRALAECCCDDWAVRRTDAPLALATALARVTEWIATAPPTLVTVGMASRESLALTRVRRILDPVPRSQSEPPRALVLAATATTLALVTLAAPGFSSARTARAATPIAMHAAPAVRYTITATDDAGPFTLTLEGGRVVGMTIDGVEADRARIHQTADHLLVNDIAGRPMLDITLKPGGGISWRSRPPRRVVSH